MSNQDTESLIPLVIVQNKEDKFALEKLQREDKCDAFKVVNGKKLAPLKVTFYDEFQEGTKRSHFDFVVAIFLSEDVSADDIEMQEEIYNHYATAPVFVWVYPKNDDEDGMKKLFQSTHEKSVCHGFEGNDSALKCSTIAAAFKAAEEQYQKIATGEVQQAFDKYDKDKS